MAELRWGAASDEGRLRTQNEDSFHADANLFVVADGMGGHLAGEVASEMAVVRMRASLPTDADNDLDQLVASIDEANREIYADSVRNVDQAGMGTTVTAIAVVADPHDGEVFAIANVGDSRCYVLRHGRLRQLTIDHSFVQELVAEGAITRDEARTHPRRNIVTRALGIEPSVRVDSWTMPIFQGDRLLLCSDGLVDEVADPDIAAILVEHADDPQVCADALVEAANEAGGRDNVTVVVVDVLEGDDPPDPTEEFDVVPLWADDGLEDTAETQIITDPLPDDESTDAASDGPDEGYSGDGEAGDGAGATSRVTVIPADDEASAAEVPSSGAPPLVPEAGPTPSTPASEPAAEPRRKRSRSAGLVRFLLVVGVAAVIILGFAILAAWARSGYFVAFDDDDRVAIYQGREDGFLWFDPTVEAYGRYDRDELTDESVALVEDRVHFESQDSAARFVAERLHPRPDDDATSDSTGAASDDATGDATGDGP